MLTDHSCPKAGVPEALERTTGTMVNHVLLRVSLTKYAVASGPPYMYFSISSKVAKSINPEVTLLVQIEAIVLL
jgi:hypothetical protein